MLRSVTSPSAPGVVHPLFRRVGLMLLVGFVAAGLGLEAADRLIPACVGAGVAVIVAVPLFLRGMRTPLVYAAVSTAGIVLLAYGTPSNVAWFAVCILGGWCALLAGPATGITYLVAAGVLFATQWGVVTRDPGWAPWIGGTAFTVLAALVVRHQLALVEQLRALQADLARRLRVEERARIARDLHDVIAHSLTVSLLHVSSARLAVEHDPGDAASALADAERLTRQSLDDVRATVGMLRTAGDEGIEPPAPGVDQLPGLVENLRAARLDVSLCVDGDVNGLPGTTGTSIYRIVQEALTNASRHAAGSSVQVRVAANRDGVEVSVDSDGPPGHGTGMGLLNMKERAEAVGGTLVAGPGGHGWLVHASFPHTVGPGSAS